MTGSIQVIPKSFREVVSCDVCLCPLVQVRACYVVLMALYPFPVDLNRKFAEFGSNIGDKVG